MTDFTVSERGLASVQFVAAVALSLVVFVTMTNLVVFVYGRGAVRAALDEGARAGSRVDATAVDCETRSRSVLDALLGGAMRHDVRVSCREESGSMVAAADVRFEGWLPPAVPDWSFSLRARSTKEREP